MTALAPLDEKTLDGMDLPAIKSHVKQREDAISAIFRDEPDDAKVPSEQRQEIDRYYRELEILDPVKAKLEGLADARKSIADRVNWRNQSAGNVRHGDAVSGDAMSGDAASAQFRDALSVVERDFLGSDAFKSWHGQTHPSGMPTPKGSHVESPHIRLNDFSLKTLVTSNTTPTGRYTNTTGGALVRPQFVDLVSLPFRPLKLRDVVTVINATSPLIEYPKVTGYTNNAAAVAEATDSTGNTGVKPESALALALGTSIASTIAHWMPITRQALSDAPQLRDLIDTFLGNGLDQALEDAMITGNGSAPNLQGLSTLSGTTAQAFVTDILTTTRKAITKSQLTPVFVEPNAFLMHPSDWEAVDLSQDNELRYYYGGPSQMGTPRLWGKPVVTAQAVTAGTAYTGDLKTLVLADLQEAQMYITDSHSTWFVANLLAILMELRVHFFALRPAAIIKIALS